MATQIKIERACAVCGVGIEHRDHQATTCSQECRKQVIYARRRQKTAMATASAPARKCRQCSSEIAGRKPNARFCSNDCMTAWHLEDGKQKRLNAKADRCCNWCQGTIPADQNSNALYCGGLCRKRAEKHRGREKIAFYRAVDPARYYQHRQRENEKRVLERAALSLIREIETRGLEALL